MLTPVVEIEIEYGRYLQSDKQVDDIFASAIHAKKNESADGLTH